MRRHPGHGRRPSAVRGRTPKGLGPAAGGGRYVYCIVDTDDPVQLSALGIGESEVYTVHEAGLAAVVCETPLRRYEPTQENLLLHETVNEAVMRDHTMLPMSFGTVFRSEDDVTEMLRSTAPALREVLAVVRGRVELGVKVSWDREEAMSELERTDPEVRTLKEEIGRGGDGSAYFARRQLGRVVEEAMEERANALTWSVYEPLRPLSVASRNAKLIGDDVILNVAFLVERVREDEFDQAVERLASRHEGLLSFKYTGPWPPYSFVNIRLDLEWAGSD